MKKIILSSLFLVAISISAIAQDYDMSLIPYRSGDLWGFATPDKKVVITPKYTAVDWFSEGYAAAKTGGKWGYINKAGKMVIPAKFTVAKPFLRGYFPNDKNTGGDTLLYAGASVKADGYEVCINGKGTILSKCPARSEAEQNAQPDGVILSRKTYSLPNSEGLFDKIEDDYEQNGETYYIATKNGKYGVFNTKFEMLLPFEYNLIREGQAGGKTLLAVEKNGMYGLYDAMGKEMMPLDNQSLTVVNDRMNKGYVIVKQDGRSFVKTLDGTNIVNRGYGDISYDNMGGFVLTGDNNLKGFYFTDNTYISPKYTSVELMPGGKYLKVKTFAGADGYINSTGDEFFVQ